MKTSNKILLSLFIAVLLITTGIHVALTQKYNSGQYAITKTGPKRDSISIKPVKYVRLNGVENVILVPSDSYHLELEKDMPAHFRQYISGDTLVITGDISVIPGDNSKNNLRIYEEVKLYLPELSGIVAQNSFLQVTGSSDTANMVASRIDLIDSRLSFKNHGDDRVSAGYFGDVLVTAKQRSEIDLSSGNIYFNNLSLELNKSVFRDNAMGDIKKISIIADDSSVVQVSGNNLQKLTAAGKAQ